VSDDDRDARRRRLWIILAIAAAAVIAAVTVSIVGSRRVDSDVAELRERAQSTTIDPSTIAFESYGAADNTVADNTVADVLGVDPTSLVLRQDPANQWCVTVEISHIASSQAVNFSVDDDGVLSEVNDC